MGFDLIPSNPRTHATGLTGRKVLSLLISPPNTIAFAPRVVETKDLARYGTVVSFPGVIVMLLVILVAHKTLRLS